MICTVHDIYQIEKLKQQTDEIGIFQSRESI